MTRSSVTTVVRSGSFELAGAVKTLGEDVVWKFELDWSVARASKLVTKPSRCLPQTGQRTTLSSTPGSSDVVESVSDTAPLAIG